MICAWTSSSIARLGCLTQLVFAALIAVVSGLAGDAEPDFVPRPIVLFLIFGLPGIVGLVAIQRGRGSALLGAGLASLLSAGLSFSGVTLIFIVPAVLMLVGAMVVFDGEAARGPRATLQGSARFALVLVLLLGAGASALLLTDERCWTWRETPTGIEMEPAPYTTGEMAVPVGAYGFGCSTGTISARGVGLASLLGLTALGLASLPFARGRRT